MNTVHLVFSLRHPDQVDLADWQREADFSSEAHERLLAAHARIQETVFLVDPRLEIEAELLRMRTRPMSLRQRMLLYYLLAQCARARDLTVTTNFFQAQEWLTRAEDIARPLQDFGAQVDVHDLKGTLYRAVSMYREAADEFALALAVLREHANDHRSFDPEFEATLAARAAMMGYLLGDFPLALERLQQATALRPRAVVSVRGQGTIDWAFALLHRQRNAPLDALWHVSIAVDLYRQLGQTDSLCRVLSLAADIAMDVAASSAGDDPVQKDRYLDQAASYAQEASDVGATVGDTPGVALSQLSLARLDRLRHPDLATGATDVEARIRKVLAQARQSKDDSLLIAAQTALGADLLRRGKRDQSKRWLSKAVMMADRIRAPGLALPAQRLLRQADGRSN